MTNDVRIKAHEKVLYEGTIYKVEHVNTKRDVIILDAMFKNGTIKTKYSTFKDSGYKKLTSIKTAKYTTYKDKEYYVIGFEGDTVYIINLDSLMRKIKTVDIHECLFV